MPEYYYVVSTERRAGNTRAGLQYAYGKMLFNGSAGQAADHLLDIYAGSGKVDVQIQNAEEHAIWLNDLKRDRIREAMKDVVLNGQWEGFEEKVCTTPAKEVYKRYSIRWQDFITKEEVMGFTKPDDPETWVVENTDAYTLLFLIEKKLIEEAKRLSPAPVRQQYEGKSPFARP